jgi:hypothetical protein
MTFDFAPGWMDGLLHPGPCSSATPVAAELVTLKARPTAPVYHTIAELAALVCELFAEGSLSWEQLRSLVEVPELEPHLRSALATVPAARRLQGGVR